MARKSLVLAEPAKQSLTSAFDAAERALALALSSPLVEVLPSGRFMTRDGWEAGARWQAGECARDPEGRAFLSPPSLPKRYSFYAAADEVTRAFRSEFGMAPDEERA